MTGPTKQRFSIVLEANDLDDRPPTTRLRGLLKLALRGFGLKCVTVQESGPGLESMVDISTAPSEQDSQNRIGG